MGMMTTRLIGGNGRRLLLTLTKNNNNNTTTTFSSSSPAKTILFSRTTRATTSSRIIMRQRQKEQQQSLLKMMLRTRQSSSSSGSGSGVGTGSIGIGSGSSSNSGSGGSSNFPLRTFMFRLMSAYGMIYCTSEYIVQITQCDGPSMKPTINRHGEIILIDRYTPRIYGLQGGYNGKQRIQLARTKQQQHYEKEQARRQKKNKNKRNNRYYNDDTWYEKRILCMMDDSGSSSSNTEFATIQESKDNQKTFSSNKDNIGIIGSYYKIKRLIYNMTSPISIGDVVVLRHPQKHGQVCKRVLGLPGDEVMMPSHSHNGRSGNSSNNEWITIPDGHIWVEGDNKLNSTDSRSYGPVPASLIIGRAILRIWPLRGNAILERFSKIIPSNDPNTTTSIAQLHYQRMVTTTIFPAGYQGETIIWETLDSNNNNNNNDNDNGANDEDDDNDSSNSNTNNSSDDKKKSLSSSSSQQQQARKR